MSNNQILNIKEQVPAEDVDTIINKLVIAGDLSGLTKLEQVSYYRHLCFALGLNPLTQPFALTEIDGKMTLYARKDCTEQLRKKNHISLRIVETKETDGVFAVTVEAITPDGRMDQDVGAVYTKGLAGKDLANAHMKALTKAKRRVTLSISGLGILDESELDSVSQFGLNNNLRIGSPGSGLDQWNCGRGLAMKIIQGCKAVEELGVTEAEWRALLPEGITTRKDLTQSQALIFVGVLRALWLDKQPKEGSANA